MAFSLSYIYICIYCFILNKLIRSSWAHEEQYVFYSRQYTVETRRPNLCFIYSSLHACWRTCAFNLVINIFILCWIYWVLSSRGQEQWAQCDDCSKWRRLPVDVLLPPKWTCSENVWDSSRSNIIPRLCFPSLKIFLEDLNSNGLWCVHRCSCSVPEEISLKELENLLRASKGMILATMFLLYNGSSAVQYVSKWF